MVTYSDGSAILCNRIVCDYVLLWVCVCTVAQKLEFLNSILRTNYLKAVLKLYSYVYRKYGMMIDETSVAFAVW